MFGVLDQQHCRNVHVVEVTELNVSVHIFICKIQTGNKYSR